MKRIPIALGLAALLMASSVAPEERAGKAPLPQSVPRALSLQDCIDIALKNNGRRRISNLAVEIAQAQRKQALSTYWPQMELKSAFTQWDDHPLFIFPEDTDTYTISDFLPQPIEATVTVPEKRVRLLDRTLFTTSVGLTYPLYTGGMRRALVRQASAGLEAARQQVRRTDLQVVYDVKRMYYGGVLARKLVHTGEDALARLEVTLELTENLYKRGSGKVKKTDWLKHKVVVESLRSLLARLKNNEQLVRAALVNTLGLKWDTEIELSETEIPFEPYGADLRELVAGAYRFNPDWARLKAGLDAMEARVGEARSGHMPKIALLGQLEYIGNSYDAGIVGPDQKKSWMVGVGLELPLFNGFRTRNRVREARARLSKLEGQQVLLREGLALQVKYLFLQLARTQEQEAAALEALKAAEDNRRLNVRAYQDDLVEVQDIVEAQLIESFMIAQYEKVRYDHVEARAHLELVVGTEIDDLLQGEE